jgi:hypothetical protein
MDDIEYSQAIARMRRAQPNNAVLQTLLDEALRRLIAERHAHSLTAPIAVKSPREVSAPRKIHAMTKAAVAPRSKEDRRAYMRELMRKRRAAAKGEK